MLMWNLEKNLRHRYLEQGAAGKLDIRATLGLSIVAAASYLGYAAQLRGVITAKTNRNLIKR